MAGSMQDYLWYARPDCSTGIFTLTPREIEAEEGETSVTLNEGDDGSVESICHGDRPMFFLELVVRYLSKANADTIFDLYFDPRKANGSARTFLLRHPVDNNVYVVRFMERLSRQYHGAFRHFKNIRLRVEGRASAPIQRSAI